MKFCNTYLRSISFLVIAGIVCSLSLPVFSQGRIVRVVREKPAETVIVETGSNVASNELEPETVCSNGLISFASGGSSTSDTYGNTRTYTGGNVTVKAQAWSRTKDTGVWQTAFLGNYGTAGLGVTDRTEDGSDPSHKVDNNGLLNYVIFAFDQPVIVDSAQLESVGGDSDLSLWFGTIGGAFSTPVTLSDAVLEGLTSETNDTSATGSRLADVNAGSVIGNVFVIAGRVDHNLDNFKVANLDKDCPSTRVTFVKQVQTPDQVNESTQAFGFTATGMSPTTFTLVDNNTVGPDRISVGVAASTAVTAVENLTPGWTLGDITCTGTTSANILVNLGARSVRVTPQSGQNVVCTFSNIQLRPSAAPVTLSGRATLTSERGIGGAVITVQDLMTGQSRIATTNTFGYYTIGDLEVGGSYLITISHRRYRFPVSSQFLTLEADLTSANFTGGF